MKSITWYTTQPRRAALKRGNRAKLTGSARTDCPALLQMGDAISRGPVVHIVAGFEFLRFEGTLNEKNHAGHRGCFHDYSQAPLPPPIWPSRPGPRRLRRVEYSTTGPASTSVSTVAAVRRDKCWDLVSRAQRGAARRICGGMSRCDAAAPAGQIGYRWQAANWVFGLEAQGNWADFRGSNTSL